MESGEKGRERERDKENAPIILKSYNEEENEGKCPLK
jgi:hypothetical protein